MLAYFLDIYFGLGVFAFVVMGFSFVATLVFLIDCNNSAQFLVGISFLLLSITCALALVLTPSKEFLSQFL